jgi:F1F0 ATPase subunit 2
MNPVTELSLQAPLLFLAFSVGLVSSSAFFVGLWWTVNHLQAMKNPALWLLVGFLLRVGIVIAGVLLFLDKGWPSLLSYLIGFMVARFLVVKVTGLIKPKVMAHAS